MSSRQINELKALKTSRRMCFTLRESSGSHLIEASADARLKPAKENLGSSLAPECVLSDDVTAAKKALHLFAVLVFCQWETTAREKKKKKTIFYRAHECYCKYSYSYANIFLSITSVSQSTAGMNHNVAQPPFNVGSNVCGCLYSICEGSHVKDDLPGWFSVLQEIYGAEEYLNHRQHTSQHGAGTHRKPVKCKTSLGGNIRHMVVTRNQHTRNNRRGMRDQKSCQANHLRSPEMENPTE